MFRLTLFTILVAALAIIGSSAAATSQDALTNSPVSTQDSWDWKDCGDETFLVDLKDIQVKPDPPKPGENMTVTVTGHVKQVIEDGAYADVLVKLGVVKLLQKRFDICEEARNANVSVQCPVEEGDYTIEQTVALPKEIPKAKFVVQIRSFSIDEEPIVCVDLIVDFMKRFPHFW